MRCARQFAFISICQVFDQLGDWNPRHFGDFWVFIIKIAVDEAQQVMVHRFMDAHALRNKPIVNHA